MLTLRNKDRVLSVEKPQVMGILNITPDSFYSGSRYQQLDQVIARAESMLLNGAALLDIGGQSTRPGSIRIEAEAEWSRIASPIRAIMDRFPSVLLSVDTYHASVARRALEMGVFMINDISAGEMDPDMIETVASFFAPYVVMHMRGTPETMHENTQYEDVVEEVIFRLQQKIDYCLKVGIANVVVDPGLGFAKTAAQNFQLIAHLEKFSVLKCPIMIGLSRKSFIYKTLGCSPEQALNGSTFLHAVGLQKGARILRVHDVKEAVESVRLYEQLS